MRHETVEPWAPLVFAEAEGPPLPDPAVPELILPAPVGRSEYELLCADPATPETPWFPAPVIVARDGRSTNVIGTSSFGFFHPFLFWVSYILFNDWNLPSSRPSAKPFSPLHFLISRLATPSNNIPTTKSTIPTLVETRVTPKSKSVYPGGTCAR